LPRTIEGRGSLYLRRRILMRTPPLRPLLRGRKSRKSGFFQEGKVKRSQVRAWPVTGQQRLSSIHVE
jgi:hypothetical protein